MTKIYTFFGNVPMFNHEESYRLLLLWKERWEALGYTPIVLNQYIAKQHPLWAEFNAKCELLPSINPKWYDMICYWRWLAMVQVGGGIMADYDCIGYNHKDFPPLNHYPDSLVCLQGHVPCLVYGSEKAYLEIVKGIMKYEVGRRDFSETLQPHVSDMTILEKGTLPFQKRFVVAMYGEPGWETASVVHYSTGSMLGKMPKCEWIPKLR